MVGECLKHHVPKPSGFTLIEVLLALAVIAIAFAALYQSMLNNIQHTRSLKDKTMKHWVAMQGLTQLQLGLISLPIQQPVTKTLMLFNQKWYWQLTYHATPMSDVKLLTVKISTHRAGPFTDPLDAFYYAPHALS